MLLTVSGPSHTQQQQRANIKTNDKVEETNRRAIQVLKLVKDKLFGKDFVNSIPIDEKRQVDLLIRQDTSAE